MDAFDQDNQNNQVHIVVQVGGPAPPAFNKQHRGRHGGAPGPKVGGRRFARNNNFGRKYENKFAVQHGNNKFGRKLRGNNKFGASAAHPKFAEARAEIRALKKEARELRKEAKEARAAHKATASTAERQVQAQPQHQPSAPEDNEALAAKLAELSELGFGKWPRRNAKLLARFDGDVASVAAELETRQARNESRRAARKIARGDNAAAGGPWQTLWADASSDDAAMASNSSSATSSSSSASTDDHEDAEHDDATAPGARRGRRHAGRRNVATGHGRPFARNNAARGEFAAKLEQLAAMGFTKTGCNAKLLARFDGNVEEVVKTLHTREARREERREARQARNNHAA